jgi:hypothetical protein
LGYFFIWCARPSFGRSSSAARPLVNEFLRIDLRVGWCDIFFSWCELASFFQCKTLASRAGKFVAICAAGGTTFRAVASATLQVQGAKQARLIDVVNAFLLQRERLFAPCMAAGTGDIGGGAGVAVALQTVFLFNWPPGGMVVTPAAIKHLYMTLMVEYYRCIEFLQGIQGDAFRSLHGVLGKTL